MQVQFHNPFPNNSLPEIFGNTIQEVQSYNKAPIPIAVAAAIGAVSLASQNSIDVCNPAGIISPCSIFTLTIAESGERKSSSDKFFMSAIKEFEEAQAENIEDDLIKYESELLVWEAKKKEILKNAAISGVENSSFGDFKTSFSNYDLEEHLHKKPQKPSTPKWIFDDSTIEAVLSSMHNTWPSVGFTSAEGGVFIKGRAITNLSTLNMAWDGNPIHVDRKTYGNATIKNPRMTISIMAQPSMFEYLQKMNGNEAKGSGFFNRCFISNPVSTQGFRHISDADLQPHEFHHLEIFKARITEILTANVQEMKSSSPKKIIMHFSHDAKIRWKHLYNDIEEHIRDGGWFSGMKDYASKLPENISRLAALFQFFETGKDEISLDMLTRAINVGLWYADEFRRLFPPAPSIGVEEFNAILLEEWLAQFYREHGCQWINKNYIRQRGPAQLRSASRLNSALEYLCFEGRIKLIKQNKSIIVEFNDYYFRFLRNQAQFAQSLQLVQPPMFQPTYLVASSQSTI